MTQLEKVSHWIYSLKYSDLPDGVIKMARIQVLDVLGAMSGAYQTPVCQKIKASLKGSKGDTSVFMQAEKWDLYSAAYYHAALINALELDNFSFMGHLSQSAVPVAFAICDELDLQEEDLLLSLVVAQEVTGRMGGYMATGPQQGHMRAFLHRVGAAVTVSKLYKSSPEVIAKAMAIALSLPEFPLMPASFSPDTKVLCTSPPTVEGIRAAHLARVGMDATVDILEHPLGFMRFFSYMDQVPDFWSEIGKTWVMESVSFKKYASCGYAQGAINAVLKIKPKSPFKTADIAQVTIHSPLLTIVMENFAVPHYNAGTTAVNTQFSTRRSVAVALLFGAPTGQFYAHQFQSVKEEIEALSKKVVLVHDWQKTIAMIRGFDAAISGPGKPGLFGTGNSQSTLKKFGKALKNRSLFQWSDLLAIFSIPRKDVAYFIKRILRSKWAYFVPKHRKKDYRSYEKDLSKIAFRLSATLKVELTDGSTYESNCEVPDGFMGDPNKNEVVTEKFFREAIPVMGKERSEQIHQLVLRSEGYKVKSLMKLLSHE